MRETTRRAARTALLAAVLLVLSACEGSAPGALDQIDFAPECGALDQACLATGLDSPIATGASLDLRINFKLQGSSGPPMQLRSMDGAVFVLDENTVVAKAAGVRPLMVVGPDGLVLDFIHLWVADSDALKLMGHTREGQALGELRPRVQLIQGEEQYLTVEPFSGSQRLLGSFDLVWEVEGDAVDLLEGGTFGVYRLVARQPGESVIKASALGQEVSVTVEVLP